MKSKLPAVLSTFYDVFVINQKNNKYVFIYLIIIKCNIEYNINMWDNYYRTCKVHAHRATLEFR